MKLVITVLERKINLFHNKDVVSILQRIQYVQCAKVSDFFLFIVSMPY